MKNTTVKELIKILEGMNQDAVVCHLELEGGKLTFNSFEMCVECSDEHYIDDDGNDKKGDIVAIY